MSKSLICHRREACRSHRAMVGVGFSLQTALSHRMTRSQSRNHVQEPQRWRKATKRLLNCKHAEVEEYLIAYTEQVYYGPNLPRSKQLVIVVALSNIREEGRPSNAQCKLSGVLPTFVHAVVTGSMRGSKAMTLAYLLVDGAWHDASL